MSTELKKVSQAIARIDKVGAGIAALREQYAGTVYEVTSSVGMTAAKNARLAIREPRYEIEKIRREAKRPLLDLGKQLDAEAARISAELLAIEHPIDAQIKAQEDRIEAERQAAIAAEVQRVERLQERLAAIVREPARAREFTAEQIQAVIGSLERVSIDESFEELREAAGQAKGAALHQLRQMHGAAIQAEQDAAELAQLRKERTERAIREAAAQRAARDEQAAREAREQVERDAELARAPIEPARDIPGPTPWPGMTGPLTAEPVSEPAPSYLDRSAQSCASAPRSITPLEIIDCVAAHFKLTRAEARGWLMCYDFARIQVAA